MYEIWQNASSESKDYLDRFRYEICPGAWSWIGVILPDLLFVCSSSLIEANGLRLHWQLYEHNKP